MQTRFDFDIGWNELFWSGFMQGIGTGLVLLPLNLLAFATLSPSLRTDETAFYSLSRNIGASIGISIASAMLARNLQISHADLATHVTDAVMPLIDPAMVQGMAPTGMLSAMADLEINRQALMISYLDDFYLMMWATLISVPLVLLMRSATKTPSPDDTPLAVE
jgi:DHA2 family multidrug resistance protein